MGKNTGEEIKVKCGLVAKIGISAVVLLGGLGIYSFFVGNSTNPDAGVLDRISSGLSETFNGVSEKRSSINVAYDFSGNIKITEQEEVLMSGSLDVKNLEIYANNTGLQQQISADSIETTVMFEDETKSGSVSGLDIISDNEYVYFSGKEGFGELLTVLESALAPTNLYQLSNPEEETSLVSQIKTILSEGKYVRVDNSLPIKKIFESLSDDNVFKKLAISAIMTNPDAYLKEHKIYDELQKELYSDNWINYIFTASENQLSEERENYVFNPGMCEQLSPILMEVMKQSGVPSMGEDDMMKESCNQTITGVNSLVSFGSQIYKEGDIEKGNYDFIIAQGNVIDIKFTYANNVLQAWNVFVQDPINNTLVVSIEGDKLGVQKSNIKIALEEAGMKVNGEITNGTGKIDIEGDVEGINVNGYIALDEYNLKDMKIDGNGDLGGIIATLKIIGTATEGSLDFNVVAGEEEVMKATGSYADENVSFDIKAPQIEVNGSYADHDLSFSYTEKGYDEAVKLQASVDYSDGDLTAKIKDDYSEGTLTASFNASNDFSIHGELTEGDDTGILDVTVVPESEGLTTYNAVVEFSGEKELEIIAKKVSENNVITLEGNIDIVSENVNISFDTKVTEKEPTKTYTIPTNVQDIEVTFAEIMTLPSFHQVGYFSKPEVLIVTVTAGSVLGTVAYISLTGYAQDAKNTKAYNDVRSLRSAVERSILMGDVTYKDLVISRTETQEINIRVGGKKVIEGENYFVGAINFNALGQENYGFGDDYQIAVYMQGAKAYYQILGFTTDGHGNKMPLINGNYYAQEVERFDFTTISSSEDESVIEVSGYTNFAEGDVTNLGEITKITGDKITLSGNLEGGITKIYLLGNDSASLFEEDGIILINGY